MNAVARQEPGRIVRIADGVVAEVVELVSPLPRKLGPLLTSLRAVRHCPTRLIGTRRACTDLEHAYQPWLAGVFAGLELRLSLCAFCGVVEVRDVSFDILPGAMGRGKPRRRDAVIGRYAGARPAGRIYL